MVYKNKLIILFVLILVGCGTTKQIEIKPRAVIPPVIEGKLKSEEVMEGKDTILIANEIVKKDTVTQIRYYPKTKTFYYKVKPDTIIIMDTVRAEIIKEKVKEKYNSWAMYIYMFGAVMFIIMTIKLFK